LAPAFTQLAQIALSVGGMFLYLRRLGAERAAGLLGGLIFVTSGYMISSVREEVKQVGGDGKVEMFDKPLDVLHLLERIQLRLEPYGEASDRGD